MHIHQLSVSYIPAQDRILARINSTEGDEMRLWLTRRLMLGLWPMLSKMFTDHLLKLESAGTTLDKSDPELKRMLADFRKEEFLQQADFETPYNEKRTRLPLGEEPLLVTDVDATPLAAGPLRLAFNERPQTGDSPRNFQMEMEPKLMQGVMHLLEKALEQSGWRDPFDPVTGNEEQAGGEDGNANRRSRYLN